MEGASAPSASVSPVLLADAMADRDDNRGGGTASVAASNAASSGAGEKPGVSYQPPQGAWKDGLCVWWSQLFPSCLITILAPVLTLSLLSQRVGWSLKKTPLDGCCCPSGPDSHFRRTQQRVRLSVFLACVWAFLALWTAFNLDNNWTYVQLGLYITLVVLHYLEIPVIILARVRQRARERLQLPPLCGSPQAGDRTAFMGDYLLSCFCPHLVSAQLLRHLFDFRGRCDGRLLPKGREDAETLV